MGVVVVEDSALAAALINPLEPLKVNEATIKSDTNKVQFLYMIRLTIIHLFNIVVIFPFEIIDLQEKHSQNGACS